MENIELDGELIAFRDAGYTRMDDVYDAAKGMMVENFCKKICEWCKINNITPILCKFNDITFYVHKESFWLDIYEKYRIQSDLI